METLELNVGKVDNESYRYVIGKYCYDCDLIEKNKCRDYACIPEERNDKKRKELF